MFSVHTQIRRGHGKLYSVFLLFSCLMCLFLLCSLLLFIFFFLLFLLIGSSLFSSLVRCTVLCYICLHLVHIFIIHTNCDKIGQRAQFSGSAARGTFNFHRFFVSFTFFFLLTLFLVVLWRIRHVYMFYLCNKHNKCCLYVFISS